MSPRLDPPYAIGTTVYDPDLKEDILQAMDDTTAVRRITAARFMYEAVCYFLTLPVYARDQAMHTNKYPPRAPGRPKKEEGS